MTLSEYNLINTTIKINLDEHDFTYFLSHAKSKHQNEIYQIFEQIVHHPGIDEYIRNLMADNWDKYALMDYLEARYNVCFREEVKFYMEGMTHNEEI